MNTNPIEQFKEAIRSHGLIPPDVIEADGSLHRFPSNGRKGDEAGCYVLHLDGIPAGWIGDWRTGISRTWRPEIGRTLTPIEEAAHKAKIATMQKERKAEEMRRQAKAMERANKLWKEALPCTAHPYLTSKEISPYGVRLYNDSLVIPIRDEHGALHSLQFIDAGGNKRYLKGGQVAGCYHSIGKLKGALALCLAEGYATCATIIEATKLPVVVTFNAGNIEAVARAMRAKFPDLRLILCADDDYQTDSNPGLTKAKEAAKAVNGLVAIPVFDTDRPEKATDFNDMAQLYGLESVKRILEKVITPDLEKQKSNDTTQKTDALDVPDVQTNNGADLSGTSSKTAGVPDVLVKIPTEEERPCFHVSDDEVTLDDKSKLRSGVYHFGKKVTKGGTTSLTQQWICTPLHIDAVTFDSQDNNFGRLLRFKTTTGKWRTWAMPMDLLSGSGEGLRGELLAMGVSIDPNSHRLLGQYLQDKTPEERMHCAVQVGWCGDSFVLPDSVIGDSSTKIIFQSGERGHDEFTCGGTLEGWKSDIAALAIGNPVLMLVLSASFVGALLSRCGAESGGLHLVGDSSTGKTTLLKVASSTWGGAAYARSWKATANGMEAVAALFNDGLLALDEISECDPRDIGAIIYSLGNGTGKQRASRTGNARGVTRWRCIILSSGERSIGTAMLEGGHRMKAGQSMRLLDLPMTGSYGAWDNLHEFSSGAAFSDAIKQAALTHYGHAGRAFLEKLTRDKSNFCKSLERIKALPEFSTENGEGQDKRAAGRFALMALAGELSVEYGITGWEEGAATKAASIAFNTWQSMRGRGNDERRQIVNQLTSFIEKHGDSRFSNADNTTDTVRNNRAGYWRGEGVDRVYLFNKDGLHEALHGFDFKRALDCLQEAGAILDTSGERSRPLTICGQKTRFYIIHYSKLGGGHGG